MRSLLFLIFVHALPLLVVSQQKNDKEIIDFVKQQTDSFFSKSNVPGIYVGLILNGERFYYGNGYAIPDTQVPFDSTTIFEAGSVTKTFTAYIVTAVLAEKGIPDSTSIIGYLPDSLQSNKALERISFLQLLNHSSGLPRLPDNMSVSAGNQSPYDNYDSDQLFAYLKTAMPKPDGKSNYSNLGMGLAGVLAERISGLSFSKLLEQKIFIPFGILQPGQPFEKKPVQSQGYFDTKPSKYWNMNVLAPAGGLKCSATEMLGYLAYMSKPKDLQMGKTIQTMLEPTITISPKLKIGKGWHLYDAGNGKTIYWHNGGTFGFSTFAAFEQGSQNGVFVVVNKFSSNAVSDALGMKIMKKILMKEEALKSFLDKKVKEYNHPSFIAADPICIPHRFTSSADIEISGFFAALFAWGNRTTIIQKASELMQLMDNAPHAFCLHHTDNDLKRLLAFKHRTFTTTDILYFVLFFKQHYSISNSLETAFIPKGEQENTGIENRLNYFYDYFFSLPDVPHRTTKHIASPAKKSACKRINMFLRWMVRNDNAGVDFGIWTTIKPSEIIIPLDLHVARVARHFGLLQRSQTDWQAAVELTNTLRQFDRQDPVKYDFALFALGILEKF